MTPCWGAVFQAVKDTYGCRFHSSKRMGLRWRPFGGVIPKRPQSTAVARFYRSVQNSAGTLAGSCCAASPVVLSPAILSASVMIRSRAYGELSSVTATTTAFSGGLTPARTRIPPPGAFSGSMRGHNSSVTNLAAMRTGCCGFQTDVPSMWVLLPRRAATSKVGSPGTLLSGCCPTGTTRMPGFFGRSCCGIGCGNGSSGF